MSDTGLTLFRERFPSIYSAFSPIFSVPNVSDKDRNEFFDNLCIYYDLVDCTKDPVKINDAYGKLIKSPIVSQHRIYSFLIHFPLWNTLSPPCVNMLEDTLSGYAGILFQDRHKTIERLLDSGGFWGCYLELECAHGFAKAGYKVTILHDNNPKNKYADLLVEGSGDVYNVEVSNRIYEINKDTLVNTVRQKIEEEATQLKTSKFPNIIIICVTYVPSAMSPFEKFDIHKRINIFEFAHKVMHDESSQYGSVIKDNIETRKSKLIIETYHPLLHIDAVAVWFHGQVFIEQFGKQNKLVWPFAKQPHDIKIHQLFRKVVSA